MAPAIAVFSPLMWQRENVVGSLANGAQDGAALDRRGWVSFWRKYVEGGICPR